ncbi:MAG: tRNA lysidine(34) synthetase TilS [Candidatus Scatosoma sp.]
MVYFQGMDLRKFKGKRICVACSGGEDSVCLLHFLKSHENLYGYSLSAVHVEHGIRGEESRSDAAFVAELCKKNGIFLYLFSADCLSLAKTEKISVETAARKARYAVFDNLLSQGKADFIATAHHAGDEAETVLFHLLRGASLTGAGGIKEERGKYIRPFLFYTKAEISAYAKAHGIAFRVDKTNFIADTTRNKLRLNVLPALEETVPGAAENLTRFAQIARADDEFLYRLAKKLVRVQYGEEGKSGGVTRVSVKVPSGKQAETQSPLFYRACVTAMKALGLTQDYSYAHLRALANLCSLQTGSEITLPHGVRAKRIYDEIVFFKAESEEEKRTKQAEDDRAEAPFRYGVTELCGVKICIAKGKAEAEEFLKFCGGGGKQKILYADGEKLRGGVLRFKRAGDTFEKFGGGRKTLKKYLTDKKIPAEERKNTPLICKGGDVLAIFGTEISEGVKCTDDTRETAYLAFCAARG